MEDAVRRLIEDRLNEMRQTMRWLSQQLGKNHAYIQQYVSKKKPQELDYRDKLKVHKLLGIPLAKLGLAIPADAAPSPAAESLGLNPDVVPHKPEAFLVPTPTTSFFEVVSRALERHKKFGARPGDIIVVDNSDAALSVLATDEAYLVKLYDKDNPLTVTAVIRQFVNDHLLITNSNQANSAMSLDDLALPFEPIIEGKIVSLIRRS